MERKDLRTRVFLLLCCAPVVNAPFDIHKGCVLVQWVLYFCRLKADIERKKKALDTLNEKMKSKEELKDVALGTSKINYLDPRITVAWCKRMDVPLEKVFNKSLLGKFSWAMEVEPEFRF